MSSVTASGHPSWWRSAACRSADPDLFFPVSASGRSLEQVERAKAVCRRCIVRRQCLQYAVNTEEPHGIWGGMTEDERRRVTRYRPGIGLAAGHEPGRTRD